jgi:DNA invertase Pin-like site-specific DNA recombinase
MNPPHGNTGHAPAGQYAALIRCSTDKQDEEMKTQRRLIKADLGSEAKIKWFTEPATSGSLPFARRPVLLKALAYCKANDATLTLLTIDRFSRRAWETLKFFDEQVRTNKIKIRVCDDPFLDPEMLPLRIALSQMERERIRRRTKAALATIKAEIDEKGFYIARNSGKRITKLGNQDDLSFALAQAKGGAKTRENTRARNEELLPLIKSLRDEGMSMAKVAQHLNERTIPLTSGTVPNVELGPKWHASQVANVLKRSSK